MTALRVHGDTLVSPGQLDFAVNIWPEQRPRRGDGYPDERAARAAVARRHGRDPSEVLLTNGACEAFWLFAHALRPRRAACVHPSFTEPEVAFSAVGARVLHVLRRPEGWRLEPDAVPDEAEIVVVGNPNNPTGTLDARAGILALAQLPGVRVWPSAANFLLLQVPNGREVVDGLRLRGIAVRPAASFPGLDHDHMRVAVRTAADNDRLVAGLAEALG